jgi:hypothetical protein
VLALRLDWLAMGLRTHEKMCQMREWEALLADPPAPTAPPPLADEYFVHRNAGGAVFVKEGSFFRQQGGENAEWGRHWTKVHATSIEHARQIGESTLPR